MAIERTRFGGMNAKRCRMICRHCQREYNQAWKRGDDLTKFNRGRYTLSRRPELYKIAKYRNCPWCGSSDVRSDEMNRRREMQRRDTCNCDYIPFPHQKGTVLGCDHHPKPYDQWTQEDEEQIQAMLATPRSG